MSFKYYYEQIIAELNQLPQALKYFTTSKKKALYVGCTGMSNLGDEAILYALRESLKANLMFYEIIYNKPDSGKYLRRFFSERATIGGGNRCRAIRAAAVDCVRRRSDALTAFFIANISGLRQAGKSNLRT